MHNNLVKSITDIQTFHDGIDTQPTEHINLVVDKCHEVKVRLGRLLPFLTSFYISVPLNLVQFLFYWHRVFVMQLLEALLFCDLVFEG